MADSPSDPDEALREHFMRLREVDGVPTLEVGIVEWPHPHTPELRWEVARRFQAVPSSDELRRAQQSALEDPHFFRTCSMCRERQNAGHMHSRRVCQGCAEKHLGVVH